VTNTTAARSTILRISPQINKKEYPLVLRFHAKKAPTETADAFWYTLIL
jgi:hypothetical protein